MSTDTSGKPTRLGKFGIAVAAALVTLLAAEAGYRVYRRIAKDPYSSARAEARLDGLMEELRGLQFVPAAATTNAVDPDLILHPYQGYQIKWQVQSSEAAVKYFQSEEARANYDVLIIGGSVAATYGNYADRFLTPALHKDPRLAGRVIKYHNVACPGHKQPQHAAGLQWLLSSGWAPDGVLLIDGYNEIAIAEENAGVGVNPLFPSWAEIQMRMGNALNDTKTLDLKARVLDAQSEAEALNRRLRAWPLTQSALTGTWAVRALGRAVEHMREGRRALRGHIEAEMKDGHSLTVAGPSFDRSPDKVLEQTLRAWRESSRSMQAMCEVRGIQFLHVLQPAACDKGSKPLDPEEVETAGEATPWGISIAAGYPHLRESGKQLERDGVHFLDASSVFSGHTERIYSDGCHFGAEGSEILSQLIAAAFLRNWRK
jgi:hypothetical protein